jgi:hypothetical protein
MPIPEDGGSTDSKAALLCVFGALGTSLGKDLVRRSSLAALLGSIGILTGTDQHSDAIVNEIIASLQAAVKAPVKGPPLANHFMKPHLSAGGESRQQAAVQFEGPLTPGQDERQLLNGRRTGVQLGGPPAMPDRRDGRRTAVRSFPFISLTFMPFFPSLLYALITSFLPSFFPTFMPSLRFCFLPSFRFVLLVCLPSFLP